MRFPFYNYSKFYKELYAVVVMESKQIQQIKGIA